MDSTAVAGESTSERGALRVARESLKLARKKCDAHDYDAAADLAKKVLGLLAVDLSDGARDMRFECFEVEADVLLGKRELPDALSRYEQCLTARSKFEDRTSEQNMALLFKIEKTISALAIAEVDSETDYKSRWKSTLLLAAEIRLDEGGSGDKSTVEIDKGKLDKLRDGVLAQLERKKKAGRLRRDVLGGVMRFFADVSWTAMPLIMLCITAMIGFLVFRSVTTNGMQSPLDLGKTSRQSSVAARLSVGADAFVDDHTPLPTQAMPIKRDFAAVQQPVHLITDFGDKAAVVVGKKKPVEVPLSLDNMSTIAQTWLATLMHKNEWFRLGSYGILDSDGMFYFDTTTRECRLGEEMNRMAAARGHNYVNPFSGRREESTTVVFKDASIDGAVQKALRAKFWKSSKPGAVYELRLAGKGNNNKVVLCGVDHNGKMMPFTVTSPAIKQPLPQFEGVVISGQQNRFSVYLLIGSTAIVGVLLCLTASKVRRPRTKYILTFFSLVLMGIAVRAALNVWS